MREGGGKGMGRTPQNATHPAHTAHTHQRPRETTIHTNTDAEQTHNRPKPKERPRVAEEHQEKGTPTQPQRLPPTHTTHP